MNITLISGASAEFLRARKRYFETNLLAERSSCFEILKCNFTVIFSIRLAKRTTTNLMY